MTSDSVEAYHWRLLYKRVCAGGYDVCIVEMIVLLGVAMLSKKRKRQSDVCHLMDGGLESCVGISSRSICESSLLLGTTIYPV
jgi:hypothetical protein